MFTFFQSNLFIAVGVVDTTHSANQHQVSRSRLVVARTPEKERDQHGSHPKVELRNLFSAVWESKEEVLLYIRTR